MNLGHGGVFRAERGPRRRPPGRYDMKRLLLAAFLTAGFLGISQSTATAWEPPGIGANNCRRIGRITGYWMQPTRGPLYDYSSYFATNYPQLPGAAGFVARPQYRGFNGQNVQQTPPPPLAAPPASGR